VCVQRGSEIEWLGSFISHCGFSNVPSGNTVSPVDLGDVYYFTCRSSYIYAFYVKSFCSKLVFIWKMCSFIGVKNWHRL
jgi:hypothetical protein